MYFAYDVLATTDRPAHQLQHETDRMSQKLCSAYIILNPGILDVELLTQLRLGLQLLEGYVVIWVI